MNSLKKQLPLIIRIVIAALFLLSAIAKSFPIWAFEKQLVDLGIVDWCNAHYLARLIIALETAIAIAILQNHFIKTFVIPVTILLLIAFCAHLGLQMYQHGAMNGNCGCFGQLIPMTPLEAFIKNIVTILLLVYLFNNVKDKEKGSNKFIVILFIYFLSAFIMFFFFPFCPCPEKNSGNVVLPKINLSDSISKDSSTINLGDDSNSMIINKDTSNKIKVIQDSAVTISKQIDAPKATSSKFSSYKIFSGKPTNLDEGKKIVCLFVPGCDHCREAAKEIVKLAKSHKLPPVYVLFMNEETFKISEFFNEVKSIFPYFIIDDIPTFFKLLGNNATTPGINYLWNGNIIKSYEGLDDHKFNAIEMAKIIENNIK